MVRLVETYADGTAYVIWIMVFPFIKWCFCPGLLFLETILFFSHIGIYNQIGCGSSYHLNRIPLDDNLTSLRVTMQYSPGSSAMESSEGCRPLISQIHKQCFQTTRSTIIPNLPVLWLWEVVCSVQNGYFIPIESAELRMLFICVPHSH